VTVLRDHPPKEQTMRFLCLVYGQERMLGALSRSEMDRLDKDSLLYDRSLEQSGHLVVAHALESVHSATSVRVRDDEVGIIDGPFAETKEQLLGFILIEATDKNDAIQIASKIPLARLGTIEVRAIRD
jgi:hypothetical protein